jgi:hypothetical protein
MESLLSLLRFDGQLMPRLFEVIVSFLDECGVEVVLI